MRVKRRDQPCRPGRPVAAGNTSTACYDYTTSRKRDGPAEFLRKFSGYLQADAFAGYDGIYAAGTVKQVLCWAHARRKFYEARTVQPEPAHQALAFIARLYDIEREATSLEPEQRLKLRRARSRSILDQFRSWLVPTEAKVLPKSPLGQAIGYVLPRWEGWRAIVKTGHWRSITISRNARCDLAQSAAKTGSSWAATVAAVPRPTSLAS